MTFSPNYLQGVQNVSFTLFDIDQQTNDDEIHNFYAIGVTTGTPLAGTVSNLGSSVTLTGIGFGQVLDGTSPATNTGPNSDRGNATISFGALNAIGSFTFTFQNSAGAPRFQQIAIGDITFSPVPEINPTIAAASACLFGMLAVKARRRLRARRNRTE